MHVYAPLAPDAASPPPRVRRQQWIPLKWKYRCLWDATWELLIENRYQGREASAINHWNISLDCKNVNLCVYCVYAISKIRKESCISKSRNYRQLWAMWHGYWKLKLQLPKKWQMFLFSKTSLQHHGDTIWILTFS